MAADGHDDELLQQIGFKFGGMGGVATQSILGMGAKTSASNASTGSFASLGSLGNLESLDDLPDTFP